MFPRKYPKDLLLVSRWFTNAAQEGCVQKQQHWPAKGGHIAGVTNRDVLLTEMFCCS